MPLERYREKRHFAETPEPRGGRARARPGLAFVVQKHAASHLHYDFRLQVGSVLVSWAVPKGPSTRPGERRLAVHVEDHPLDYGKFEGVIPKGNYGAGRVEIWDSGTWEPEGDPRRGLSAGHLKFRLHGRKLKGGWALVRMAARAGGKEGGKEGGKDNWLLIRHADEPGQEAPKKSAVAEAVPARSARKPASPRPRRAARMTPPRGAPHARLPALLKPQLATLVEQPPAGEEWLHEIKFDGYRLLARVRAGEARLFTRTGLDWTAKFASIARAVARLPVRAAWLDGEVVAADEGGRHSFQALQRALKEGTGDFAYYIFDLLHLDGHDLAGRPLEERKRVLARLLPRAAGPLRFSDHVDGAGASTFAEACRMKLEGIVSKRRDGLYHAGRSPEWRKSKCQARQEFVIGGYTAPGGKRTGFGALLLGVRGAAGGLRYAGRVGTGFDADDLRDLTRLLATRRVTRPPFADPPAGARAPGVQWVRPDLVAEVAFTEWTTDGQLRHPSFQGLRRDKPARAVRRETPMAASGKRPRRAATPEPPSAAPLTHPERVVYPDIGLTKAELAAYFDAIAEHALPHLAGRPLALLRCPGGVEGGCFYQKHLDEATPPAIRSISITEKATPASYPWIADAAGLVALVQRGVLEIHPWGARVDDVEKPDRVVFDIDPGEGLPWSRVVAVARLVRARLEQLGLEAWLKTTGGKGVHLVVPIRRGPGWPAVKAFARAIADDLARQHPAEITAVLSKARRKGRVFIDYLRNGRGATAIGAYSTRARPGAPVATPISWDELARLGGGDRFNVRNLPRRLATLKRDPWAALADARQALSRRMLAALDAPDLA